MKTTRYIAKCKTCSTHTSALVSADDFRAAQMFEGFPKTQPEPAGRFRFVNGFSCVLCRGCSKPRIAKPVAGKISVKHVCGAKCLNSTGHVCECSCGGKNHGAGFAA
jgi:hypothetical protein